MMILLSNQHRRENIFAEGLCVSYKYNNLDIAVKHIMMKK